MSDDYLPSLCTPTAFSSLIPSLTFCFTKVFGNCFCLISSFCGHPSNAQVIEIPMNYESEAECEPGDNEIACGMSSLLTQTSSESHDNTSQYYLLQVKSGHHKRLPGFQAELVCLSPWIDRTSPPFRITSLCVNTYANL